MRDLLATVDFETIIAVSPVDTCGPAVQLVLITKDLHEIKLTGNRKVLHNARARVIQHLRDFYPDHVNTLRGCTFVTKMPPAPQVELLLPTDDAPDASIGVQLRIRQQRYLFPQDTPEEARRLYRQLVAIGMHAA